MTNSEAIKKIIEMYNDENFTEESLDAIEFDEAKELAISALEENDKLKTENGTLKRVIKHNEELRCEETKQLKAEIEQLKSELEQSVRLPCKVGDVIYDNDFGSPTPSTIVGYSFGDVYQDSDLEMDMEQIYFYSKSNRFNIDMSFPISEIGRTIFLSKEDAEQHLEDKQLKARIEADNVKKDFKEFCDIRDVEESKLKFN